MKEPVREPDDSCSAHRCSSRLKARLAARFVAPSLWAVRWNREPFGWRRGYR